MSALVNSWQTYIDQQIQLDNGVADYVAPAPVGGVTQPSAGFYPVTMPNGITRWRPCIDRIRADAMAFDVISQNGTNSPTALLAHSGKVVLVNNNGGTTAVTLTFPTGLGAKFNSIYVMNGTQSAMSFAAATGVTLNQEEGLTRARARYAMVTVIATAANVLNISGSMKA
ncbi:hypothetical protein U1701_00010 [Sphingomonas sp. PB2P19]